VTPHVDSLMDWANSQDDEAKEKFLRFITHEFLAKQGHLDSETTVGLV